jgi:hypothetical protein
MRALVVAGLVVFHSAGVFATGASWFVKDPRSAIGFTVLLLLGAESGQPTRKFLVCVTGLKSRPGPDAIE